MNVGVVALLAAVLSAPALIGMADGTVDPNQAGIRVLMAVAFAAVIEVIVRRFVHAVRPSEQRVDTVRRDLQGPGAAVDEPRRRRTDG